MDELVLKAKRNSLGHIISFSPKEDASMAQGMLITEEFLSHYGKKGMKWGVRNPRKDEKERAKQFGPGNKPSTPGGVGKPSLKQKEASKMTDKQLKAAVDRMNLEKQYNSLTDAKNEKAMTTGQRLTKKALDIAENSAASVVQKQLTNVGNRLLADYIEKKFGIKPPKDK
jgi:hypothetical protein